MQHIWRVALAGTAFAALTGVSAGGPAKVVPAGEPRILVLVNGPGMGSPSPGGGARGGPGGFGPGGAAAVGGLLGVIGGATQPSYSEPPSQYYSPYDPAQQTSPQQTPPPQQTYQPAQQDPAPQLYQPPQQAPPAVPASPAPTPAPVADTPIADTPVANASPVPDTANSALTQVMPPSAAATLATTAAAEPPPANSADPTWYIEYAARLRDPEYQKYMRYQLEKYDEQYRLEKYQQQTATQLKKGVLKDLGSLLDLK